MIYILTIFCLMCAITTVIYVGKMIDSNDEVMNCMAEQTDEVYRLLEDFKGGMYPDSLSEFDACVRKQEGPHLN